ncbi:leucyl/phenylalanyl-tRNA--protein transferase [Nocardioides houyundeii]|uniref:leucyl/phenylalanyl-tRNA--protein transferase n=1 Tax=Nocardioides houyundeii TaxID=2045452 RepID=UPI001F53900F|nr:leucyl/phenylalanyl-tRNA--protein transferase [Nocardioides houyundeii]
MEPPASSWGFDDLADLDPADDLVAIGADLRPGTLLAAYRRGLFPMPSGDAHTPPYWFFPVRRAVLPLEAMVVSRSLRRSARTMEIRVDTAFDEVIAACGDPRRPDGWIDEGVVAGYQQLHELGWAHSVEAWRDGELVGGLYGVAIGGLFAGESMFHRATDASKVALLGLVSLLRDEHADCRLLDVQWRTDHLASLGVVELTRREYAARLTEALAVPLPRAFDGDAGPLMGRSAGPGE